MITDDSQINIDKPVAEANFSQACTLDCKDKALRFDELRREVFQYNYRIEEDLDTVRLIFGNNQPSEETLQRFISLESQCCHFLTITLTAQEDGENVVTIWCPEKYKKELHGWLKSTSDINSTKPEKNISPSLGPLKKISLSVMSLSIIGLLCCIAPFIAVGLAGLGFSYALPIMTETIDNVFIALVILSMTVVGVLFMLPKLLRRIQCGNTEKC